MTLARIILGRIAMAGRYLAFFAIIALSLCTAQNATAEPPSDAKVRDIKIDGAVIVAEDGSINLDGLLKIGCEPLAALRHRILVDNGLCLSRRSYYSFYLQKICASNVNVQALYDQMPDTAWKTIEQIRNVEGQKGCRALED